MIELGNVQTLTDEKFFASLDGLPYINNSGVYDATIVDAIVGANRTTLITRSYFLACCAPMQMAKRAV